MRTMGWNAAVSVVSVLALQASVRAGLMPHDGGHNKPICDSADCPICPDRTTNVLPRWALENPVSYDRPAPVRQVRQFPDAPGSLALFLCAMGSFGAWELTRSARKCHPFHAPAWLHTGGPSQSGHVHRMTLIDQTLRPCRFDSFTAAQTPRRRPHPCIQPVKKKGQSSIRPAGPRGPPVTRPDYVRTQNSSPVTGEIQ